MKLKTNDTLQGKKSIQNTIDMIILYICYSLKVYDMKNIKDMTDLQEYTKPNTDICTSI